MFNYKKKYFFVVLCMLLLTLLLGFCGTCYASVDEVDLKNFCVNVGIHNGLTAQTVSQWVDSSTAFQSLNNACSIYYNNSGYKTLLMSSGYNVYFLVKSVIPYGYD